MQYFLNYLVALFIASQVRSMIYESTLNLHLHLMQGSSVLHCTSEYSQLVTCDLKSDVFSGL